MTVLPPGEWDPSIRIEPPKNVPSQVSLSPAGALFDLRTKELNCCWLTVKQEKRKKSNLLPNGLLEGEEEEENGGHGGPELQRTGRCEVINVICNFTSYLLFIVDPES